MLAGYRIVEVATYIAAPAATGILADWGAEVIKIEPPGGDRMRTLRVQADGSPSPTFESNNRGKRAIILDIAAGEGREALERLLADADVFVTNVRAKALRKLGLDWEAVRARNPRLIYTSVSGYGLTGDEADAPAFDNAALWARSSLGVMMPPEESPPFSLRQGMGDHVTALTTALGIVTALLNRERSGEGHLVETSLLRTGVYIMTGDISRYLRMGEIQHTPSRDAPVNPLNNFYRSAEGRWFFFMTRGKDHEWPAICTLCVLPDLIDDPRFATPEARTANSAALVALLDPAFARLSFDEIAAALMAADVVWSPMQGPAEIAEDRQAHAAGCFTEMLDASGQPFTAPASPVRFDGLPDPVHRRTAAVGADTDAVLAELGLKP